MQKVVTILAAILCTCAVSTFLLVPSEADAFCGTYVSGGGAELYNNATQVAMLREGNTTVMSMQNNYEGPPEDFAMVVPVPMVLEKSNVKTLNSELFDKVDTMTAPRLVEYYEVDPCRERRRYYGGDVGGGLADAAAVPPEDDVTVEEQFQVGEYEIKVLSSTDSSALETWLGDRGYTIPSGSGQYLEPYIQNGSKFFVAKVDAAEVEFENGEAVLSPLRFDYESPDFKLPVRLGMINSKGKQNLIVNILGKDTRYRAANYENVTIPTNMEVTEQVKGEFGQFYRTLFDSVMQEHPQAMVTEYAWNVFGCDPCPVSTLEPAHIKALGAEVVNDGDRLSHDWVITRLHTRYAKGEIGRDIVFEKADPITGGRTHTTTQDGSLSQEAQPASRNNFQGRYIIRHEWEGEVECSDPTYDRWAGSRDGGPGSSPSVSTAQGPTNGGSQPSDLEGSASLDDYTSVEQAGRDGSGGPARQSDAACAVTGTNGSPRIPLMPALCLMAIALYGRRHRVSSAD